jgi:uncharacterized membrane protein
MTDRKLLPAISVAVGITLIITGLFGIVSYIVTLYESSNQADQSLIFWYLPFLLFGFMFIIIGTLFTVMGIKSLAGKEDAYKTTKVLLIILSAIILLISSFTLVNSLII